jgi:lipoprotein-releasing system ATP-binding protein
MEVLAGKSIHKSFGDLKVLKGIDLNVDEGEIVAITGRSGAGKSTLLHLLGTLDKPDDGQITIAGTDVTKLGGKELARFRNKHIGFVFQFHHLLPEFTALENIAIPALLSGMGKKEALSKAEELVEYFGLMPRREHKPGQLSGGEQQRIAVARALINKPTIVLADEPTGNLDNANARELMSLFKQLQETHRHSFVIVTHSQELASTSDRVINLVDGRIA